MNTERLAAKSLEERIKLAKERLSSELVALPAAGIILTTDDVELRLACHNNIYHIGPANRRYRIGFRYSAPKQEPEHKLLSIDPEFDRLTSITLKNFPEIIIFHHLQGFEYFIPSNYSLKNFKEYTETLRELGFLGRGIQGIIETI